MSLQFIAGGSGSGKTRYLYEKVIKESEEHPDIQYLFIVPEQYTMQTQKELVRLHPRHGLLNIDVLSFKRLAYRVFEDLGVQLPQVLDDMGKSMVIRKVAGKLKKELKLYGGHLEQPGFINQLKSQISELCQYGVSVEDLAMVEEETDRVLLKDKLGDLKTVYGGFKDYIESGQLALYDADDDCGVVEGDHMRCRAGITSFWMTWEGKMLPCGMIPDKGKNPWEIGFDKAWENAKNIVSEITLPVKCAGCGKKDECKACAAMVYTETGTYDKVPQYRCEMTKNYPKACKKVLKELEQQL